MNKEQAIAYLRSNRPTSGFPGLAEAVDIGIAAIEESITTTHINERNRMPEYEEVTFGDALEALKTGRKVQRKGWNGKGMWLILVPGSPNIKPVAGTPYSKAGIENEVTINPHIDMMTATGEMQPGWLASQTDMLAIDWMLLA